VNESVSPLSTIFDDLSHWHRWPRMLAGCRPGEQLELERVKQIVCGGASPSDAERHGEHWVTSFLDFCERGRIAQLYARADGSFVLVLSDPLPTEEQAWERVEATWPELEREMSD
jgi:hypothetical protein